MARIGKCARNHNRIVELSSSGHSLSYMERTLGVGHRHIAKHIRKHGIPHTYKQAGPNSPKWQGGVCIDKHGYRLLHRPDHPRANSGGYVREHRLVMEAKLGRLLLPQEVVHHVDGNRSNNTPSNLVLYASNGQHLADELRGKCPKWTPEGKANILRACRSQKERRLAATQSGSRTSEMTRP